MLQLEVYIAETTNEEIVLSNGIFKPRQNSVTVFVQVLWFNVAGVGTLVVLSYKSFFMHI